MQQHLKQAGGRRGRLLSRMQRAANAGLPQGDARGALSLLHTVSPPVRGSSRALRPLPGAAVPCQPIKCQPEGRLGGYADVTGGQAGPHLVAAEGEECAGRIPGRAARHVAHPSVGRVEEKHLEACQTTTACSAAYVLMNKNRK